MTTLPAKKKKIKIPKINLVPKDPFYDSLIGKIMVWATQVGRYLIVFTEIVVIISFASRFKLDRDLTDLTASVTQKKAIVESYGETENQIRAAQKKLELIKAATATQTTAVYLDALIKHIPTDIQLNLISYSQSELLLSGRSKSSGSIASLITALQNDPTFKGLTIDKISSGDSQDPTITFSFRLQLIAKQDGKSSPKPAQKPSEALEK